MVAFYHKEPKMTNALRTLEAKVDELTDRVRALERGETTFRVDGPGKYRCRDGCFAYVYTVHGRDPHYPVVGERETQYGTTADSWTPGGTWDTDEAACDLVSKVTDTCQ
jgi:hypothetical protein